MNKKYIIDEYMKSDIINIVSIGNRKYHFKINDKYGFGNIKVYEILEGIFLSYNDYEFPMNVVDDGKAYYQKPVLIIHHCFHGGYRISLVDKLLSIVNQGDSQFYAGEGEFTESSIDAKGCKTISISCYYEDFIKSLSKYLDFNYSVLNNYLYDLDNFGDLLVTKTNIKTLNIIDEIIHAVKSNDEAKIKIKSYELIYEDIMNYEQYVKRFKKLYSKEFLIKIEDIKIFLEKNWENNYNLEEISNIFAISKTYIKEGFAYMYQSGPSTYMRKFRIKKSCEFLINSEKSIIEIAGICGYSNPSKFSNAFKNEIGVLPSKYRKITNNETI